MVVTLPALSHIMPDFNCKRKDILTGLKSLIGQIVHVPRSSFNGGNRLAGHDTMRIIGVSISHTDNIQCTVKCLDTNATCKIWPWQLMHSGSVALSRDICFTPAETNYTPSQCRNQEVARWCKRLLQPGDNALVLDGMSGGTSTALRGCNIDGLTIYSANTCQNTALVRAVAGDRPLYLPLSTPGKRWPPKGIMELLGLSLDKPHMLSDDARQACSAPALLLDMYGTWQKDYNRILQGLVRTSPRVILLTYCTRNSPYRPSIPDNYTCVYHGHRASMRWIILVPTKPASTYRNRNVDEEETTIESETKMVRPTTASRYTDRCNRKRSRLG